MTTLLTDILGWAATVVCVVMMSSALQVLYRIVRTQSAGPIDISAFLAQFMNCLAWTLYGVLIDAYPVMVANGYGIVTAVLFVTAYLSVSTPEQWRNARVRTAITLVLFALVSAASFYVPAAVLGIIGAVMSVCIFTLPLREIYRTRSTACISVMLYVTGLFSGLLWVAYGVTMSDFYIITPNATNSVTTVVVLGLWVWEFVVRKQGSALLDSEKVALTAAQEVPHSEE